MAFKRKDEHFNDFGYQQENISNANTANSEQNLDPMPGNFNEIL